MRDVAGHAREEVGDAGHESEIEAADMATEARRNTQTVSVLCCFILQLSTTYLPGPSYSHAMRSFVSSPP
jgi:hypothetical protein